METMVKSLKHQLAVYKKKDDPMLSERTVDEALQKIEMLVAESSSFMMDHHQSRRRVIVDAELIHSFVMFWKKVALVQKHKTKAESILNPHQLLIKLHALSRKQTELRYETRTIGLLLDVVIGTAENPQSAPELAEGWVQHLHSISETTNTTIPSIHRDVYTYSKTIQAWATSGRTDAPSRIDALWKQLQAEGIQLNEVTSNILLRFWGRHIDHGVGVEQIRAILSHMKDQKVEPSLANLAQAVYGFSRTHDRLKATEKLFFKMVRNKPRYKKEYQLIEESAIHVLLAHRKALDAAAHGTEKVKAISAAENFFTKAEKFAVEASSSLLSREAGKVSKLVVSMMDIYARAGLHGEVESLLNRIQPNLVVYSILIKSYGRYDMAEEAAAVLRRVLREAQIVPDIHLFNELINAYVSTYICLCLIDAQNEASS
jgi:pentatricopeptide repeat protein